MLEAKNLRKVYSNGASELCVLKGVNLEIARGEIVSIVGPSGAGKSTLLHILGGLDEGGSGDVFLDGVCLSALDERRKSGVRNRKFGFVFQFYHLLHEFSALENVMMPALVASSGKSEKALKDRANQLLDFLGLSQRMTHKPSQLSGGEQQRVTIARALMNDPAVLFCDEPTGNLDHASGHYIQELLFKLNKEKKTTIVIVTHSRELAAGSNRIFNMLDGEIVSVEKIH